jgi:type IV secretion system protein TrbB
LIASADNDHPIVEGELPIERIRFEGLMSPVVRRACFVMRKPAQVLYTLNEYVRDGIVTAAQAEIFRDATHRRLNIAIAGSTGSGKTTFVGALINEMVASSDQSERYVIIEDTLEIRCRAENLVQLHTSEAIDLTRLVRATMRLRPDRIIIGEVRGDEALALVKAWLTGHPGGVTSIHANSGQGGTDPAFQSRLGSGCAASTGADRRNHRSDRFHCADTARPQGHGTGARRKR